MLVLLDVKGVVVVPAKGHGVLESGEAVVNRALVGARAHCRVTEGHELVVVGLEDFPGVDETFAEDDDHVAAHQEGSVGLLGVVNRRVVVDLELLIVGVIHQLLKLLAELVDLAQVQRAEVGEERFVNQVVVDAEIKRMLPGLRWVFVTDPVEATWDNLNGLIQGVLLLLYHLINAIQSCTLSIHLFALLNSSNSPHGVLGFWGTPFYDPEGTKVRG